MPTKLCPVLGDSAPCPFCGSLLHLRHVPEVIDAAVRYMLYCYRCCARTRLEFARRSEVDGVLLCRNCGKPPTAHQDGRCLFGPAKYTPIELSWLWQGDTL